jgi:glycosyltransferase involved in cell wall biosynthesis
MKDISGRMLSQMRASIIIPSYNSKERLYLNLTALNLQTYDDDDVEVVVVDNGSTDNTMEMLQKFKLKYPMQAIRIEKNEGIAKGRNKGVLSAKGDILIFHDSDMIANKDFIKQHLEIHEEPDVVACGLFWRRVYTHYYKSFSSEQRASFEKMRDKMGMKPLSVYWDGYPLVTEDWIKNNDIWQYSFDLDFCFIDNLKSIVTQYGRRFEDYYLPWRFCLTNNLSVEHQRVLDVGMFDANIVRYGYEDYDLGIRLYKSGSKFVMADHIISIHQEHPANYKPDDLLINVNYICEKYNSIYFIDVPLVCMSDSLGINGDDQNQIMKEINTLIQTPEYHVLLELFLETLQIIRKRLFAPSQENIRGAVIKLYPKLNHYAKAASILREEGNGKCFLQHMSLIFHKAFGISLERLLRANEKRGDGNYE